MQAMQSTHRSTPAAPTTHTVAGRVAHPETGQMVEGRATFARGLVFMLTEEAAGWSALQVGPRGIGPRDHVVVTWTHPDAYTWEGHNLTTGKRVQGMAEAWVIRGFRAVGTMTDQPLGPDASQGQALWLTELEDVEG